MSKEATKTPAITAVKFTKSGILAIYDNGHKQRIGDPVNVIALAAGIQDKLAYTVLKLQDRDGSWRTAIVRSSLLTAKTMDFRTELTDQYHYRLPNKNYVGLVIDALAARNQERRIAVTMVPGWHGPDHYVFPYETIKPDGDDWRCLLAETPNVHLGRFRRSGKLGQWKRGVARYCCLSSRLRLAVGAAFVAPILRMLTLDTFGLYFVGTTSSGKTLCLRVAGSVPGFNSESGPTSWDGTPTGFEQLALGTRDSIMLLDDIDNIAGDKNKRAEFVTLTTLRLSKNRPKLRAGHYVQAHGVNSDHRGIVISSGEDVLIEARQVRGQDVRMIHIPACVSNLDDIFDSSVGCNNRRGP